MSKLIKLKEWVTVEEAARHITAVVGEPISEADLLQLSLDGALKLSAYFSTNIRGKRGRKVPVASAEVVPGIPIKGEPPYEIVLGVYIDEGHVLEFDEPVRFISGDLFDLPMIGGEEISPRRRLHNLLGVPDEPLTNIDGCFLYDKVEGEYWQLYEDYLPERKEGDTRPDWQRRADAVQFPVGSLGPQHALVVRTEALSEFIASLGQTERPSGDAADRQLNMRERNSWQTIVGALVGLLVKPDGPYMDHTAVVARLVSKYADSTPDGLSKSNLRKVKESVDYHRGAGKK